jgi:galactosylceramide sulfotransferase/galactose-3-O-sulfotransferase 3
MKSSYRGLSLKDLSLILYTNSPNLTKINFNKRFYGRIGRNQMSFDLGLDPYYFENLNIIKSFIKKLDKYFNLVMIAERMDESLILLRHLLCWSIDNVIVFKHNVRYRSDSSTIQFNQLVKNKLRLFNRADQMLYNHFYKKFELQVEKFGYERMKHEVEILKEETHKLYVKCVDKELLLSDLLPNSSYILPKTKILANKVKNTTDPICWSLTAPELLYTDLLKQKQLYLFPDYWFTTQPIINALYG